MTRFASACVLATALMTLLIAPACYTLLKHPRVKHDVVYQELDDKRCSTCHTKDELWAFHHSPTHPQRYTIGYNWFYYYDLPWWYNPDWYSIDENDPSTIPYHSRQTRPGADKQPASADGAVIPDTNPHRLSIDKKDGNNEATQSNTSKNRTDPPAAKTQKGETAEKTN
jgi:hypothetical protein